MSLYRQLWFALVLTMALALVGSLLASTLNARAYLQEQLRFKNADNATALSLSLSHANVDRVEIELKVAAMFDTGNYEWIRVTDPLGEPLVERIAKPGQSRTPQWFMQSLPIAAPPGKAMISDGWKQVGQISLASHSRFAYQALWQSVLQLTLTLGMAGLLAGYLGSLILRRLKRPLDAVIEQAKGITERRFVTSPESSVPELRQLSSAMNFAVVRLKSMFEEESSRLESIRRDANHDPLTGLFNRVYLLAGLATLLESDESPAGSLMFIRIGGLADINRELGRANTDQLLRAAANVIATRARQNPDAIAARMNGADFALLLPGEPPLQATAYELLNVFVSEIGTYTENPKVYIGLAEYDFNMDPSGVLAQVDTALAEAESGGGSDVRVAGNATNQPVPRSADEWSAMLQLALGSRWGRLAAFPVIDTSGNLLHHECPLRLKFDADGEWQPAGYFLPMTERLELTAQLDILAVQLGLEKLRLDAGLQGVAINLSGRSIRHAAFRQQLLSLLHTRPTVSHRLWLEVSENGALNHLDAFQTFCAEMKGTKCKIGLEHFGRQFSQIGQFHGLGIAYIKVDASFIRDLDQHPGNQAFLKGLCAIAQTMGFQSIAEGVSTQAELDTVRLLGFDGATGPAIKDQLPG